MNIPPLMRSRGRRRAGAWLTAVMLPLVGAMAGPPADTLTVTLAGSIRMAQEHGPAAEMARQSYRSKEQSHRAFDAGFLPQLSLSGDAPGFYRSINSIVQPDGSTTFEQQRQASSSLGLQLSQKIAATGTELSLFSGLNRIDLIESDVSYYRSTPLTLSLRQPLFTINTLAWSRAMDDLQYRGARREYVEAMEDVAIQVTDQFFSVYLAAMNVSNAALNCAINDTLYQISQGRYNVGKIAEQDLLQSELAALNSRTQLENARLSYERAAQTLRNALGLPPDEMIRVRPDAEIPSMLVDADRALNYARTNRSDMLNFELERLSAARNVRQAESDNSLSMSVSANLGYNQKATQLPDAYGHLLDQQQFSVRFDVPLFGWGTGTHAVEAARAEQERVKVAVEQQRFTFEQEVVYQVRRLQQLQLQVGVAAKADTIAQRRFDVARERYVIGKIDVPILFIAQEEKDNAYRARIQTLWDYWSTYYRVRRLTLYDFASRRPLYQE